MNGVIYSRSTRVLTLLPFMKAGLPLPNYPDNKEFFKYASREQYDPRRGSQSYLDHNWDRFLNFYRGLIPNQGK